ncbi:MAG: hypothetical protein GXP28_06045, partial [Planctomycetes bacterium]|nr:hypothetical protein [Planctomycetota bacterium]
MRGGKLGGLRQCCANQLALAAMMGGLWSLSSGTMIQTTEAANGVTEDQCETRFRNEQSILVASSKSPGEALLMGVASDALEPIANSSMQVPDLAEVRVPDLAGPVEISDRAITALAELEVLSFHGVTPGVSSRRDVLREWGDPRTEDTTAETLPYRFDKLRSVRVKFEGNVVEAIVVELASPLSTEELASKLSLNAIRPALLADESGDPLALAFPERGIVLRYSGEGQVGEIVIQPIKAASFLLRAESYAKTNLSACREDLHVALDLDRTSASTRRLLSDIYLTLGQAVAAERYSAEALEIEPRNHAARLQHAKCLRQLARYELAISETRKVLASSEENSLDRATALYEMSQLAAFGSQGEAQEAVGLLTKSIEIADELAIASDDPVSQQAKQLLVETHLAMAVEIARGEWSLEDQMVPQWIERASALSEEMIATDASDLPLRLRVAVSALAAAASLETPIDPLLWIEEAEETVQLLQASIQDRETRGQYEWQLGLAYFHGAQVQHRRSEPDSAERLAKLAITKLRDLAKQRDELPDTAYLMGRLYFQIGAIHAVHH